MSKACTTKLRGFYLFIHRSKLLNARAKKLLVEMYTGGVLPTKEELTAHIRLLTLEEVALTHTNVVMAELSSAQKCAKMAFEKYGGHLMVVKQALRNKRVAEAQKTDEQAAEQMGALGKADNRDKELALKASTGMFQVRQQHNCLFRQSERTFY